MLNVVQKSFFVFIFLNIAFSKAMYNDEQKIAHGEILKIVNTVVKNNKFENDNIEKIKNFITSNHIDPNLIIDIQQLDTSAQLRFQYFFILLLEKLEKSTTLLHLAVAYKQADLTNFLLEHGADSNIRVNNGETALDILLRSQRSEFDKKFGKLPGNGMIILKDLLQHRADVNIGNYMHDNHPLKNTIMHDIMLAILDRHGVMINKQNSQILLQESIKNSLDYTNGSHYSNKTIIKDLLLYTEASIDSNNENNGNTIFHSIASNVKLYLQSPKVAVNTMQTILTHARPQDWTQTIKTALLLFNRLNLPREMQILIFSKLPEDHFKNSSGLLYKLVFPKEYQKYYTIQMEIENRVGWINGILQKTNNEGKTASQILASKMYYIAQNKCLSPVYSTDILYWLMNGSQLTKDYDTFKENPTMLNPDYVAANPEKAEKWKQNLIYQMIESKALTLMQPKKS